MTAADTTDPNLVAGLRDVCEAWLVIAQSMVEQRRFGVFPRVVWDTNEVARLVGPITWAEKNQTPEAVQHMSYALPAFGSIRAHVSAIGTESEKVAATMVETFMRRIGAKETWEREQSVAAGGAEDTPVVPELRSIGSASLLSDGKCPCGSGAPFVDCHGDAADGMR